MGVRRIAENGMMTLPVFALLFILAALGTPRPFPLDLLSITTNFEGLKRLSQRNLFLREGRGLLRLWTLRAFTTKGQSLKMLSVIKRITKLLVVLSPIGIAKSTLFLTNLCSLRLVNVPTASLVFHHFRGLLFAGSMLFTFSFMVLVLMGLQKAGALKNVVTTEHYHDLGKFMFGFTVFWAYIGFSQFMLIWYANIPEEVDFIIIALRTVGKRFLGLCQ